MLCAVFHSQEISTLKGIGACGKMITVRLTLSGLNWVVVQFPQPILYFVTRSLHSNKADNTFGYSHASSEQHIKIAISLQTLHFHCFLKLDVLMAYIFAPHKCTLPCSQILHHWYIWSIRGTKGGGPGAGGPRQGSSEFPDALQLDVCYTQLHWVLAALASLACSAPIAARLCTLRGLPPALLAAVKVCVRMVRCAWLQGHVLTLARIPPIAQLCNRV